MFVVGEFHTKVGGCGSLTMLPVFRDKNAIGAVLKENDEAKLHYLTFPMTA